MWSVCSSKLINSFSLHLNFESFYQINLVLNNFWKNVFVNNFQFFLIIHYCAVITQSISKLITILIPLCDVRLTSDETKNIYIASLHLFESELVRRMFIVKRLMYASSQISVSVSLSWGLQFAVHRSVRLASHGRWPISLTRKRRIFFFEHIRCIWSITDAMSAFWSVKIIHLSSVTCRDLFREHHFAGKHRSVKYACTSTSRIRAFSLINHAIMILVKKREKKQS